MKKIIFVLSVFLLAGCSGHVSSGAYRNLSEDVCFGIQLLMVQIIVFSLKERLS